MDCNICNNCGKTGHLFQQCNLPINSYGIIAFTFLPESTTDAPVPAYLMIRRKDSFGYIDFIRGKYSPYNYHQLRRIVDEMSIDEKTSLMTAINSIDPSSNPIEHVFYRLWTQMWGKKLPADYFEKLPQPFRYRYKSEEESTFKKFQTVVTGVYNYHNVSATAPACYDLPYLIQSSTTTWTETEWEFPKGRRNNPREKELVCAIREFEEETGINITSASGANTAVDAAVIEDIHPFEEIFIGTNCKAYKHKYFLVYISPTKLQFNSFQQNEVSKLECVTLEQALKYIRPYNIEKKQLLQHVHEYITSVHCKVYEYEY